MDLVMGWINCTSGRGQLDWAIISLARNALGRRFAAAAALTAVVVVCVLWLRRFLAARGLAWAGDFGSAASFLLAAYMLLIQFLA
jgi:hypothetical protein